MMQSVSGEAIDAARKDYRDVAKKRQIQEALPEAWKKLIDEGDEILTELIADKVESICGYKPDPDTVTAFLSENISLTENRRKQTQTHFVRQNKYDVNKLSSVSQKQNKSGDYSFIFKGEKFQAKNGKDILIKILIELDKFDNTFFDRFVSLPKHGRTRRFIARTKEELYLNRPDLAHDHSYEIKPGWWVGTNVGANQIRRIIEMACDVAGLKFNKDLSINLGA